MKKMLLLLLMLVSFQTYAQVVPYAGVAIDYVPEADLMVNYSFIHYDQLIGVDLMAGAEFFDFFCLEGNARIYAVPPWERQDGDWTFDCFQSQFWVRAYIEVSAFDLGIEHRCDHPIETWGSMGANGWDFCYEWRVYLSFDTRELR